MSETCGGEWGDLWGSSWGPCAPLDLAAVTQARARTRLMRDPTFAAFVVAMGEAMAGVYQDAWDLAHRQQWSTAAGAMLDELGADIGFTRLGASWPDDYYRAVGAAWYLAEYGTKTIPRLLDLLAALGDGVVTSTVSEHFPGKARIEAAPLEDDDATLWAQVIEAARPEGVRFELVFSVANPGAFILGESDLGGPDVLAGSLTF